MAELNINLSQTETQDTFKPIPPGWYISTIIDSEIKQGAKGAYIRWTFEVDNFPNKVWEIMSLNNEGEAVGLKKLKTLAVVSGHPDPNFIRDTEEFHGKRCQIRLKIEEDPTGAYDPKNKIAGFKPMNGGSVQQPSKQAQKPQPIQPQIYVQPEPVQEVAPEALPWGSFDNQTAEQINAEMPF